MRRRLIIPGNIPVLMARRLTVNWCRVDRSVKRFNKARPSALQVKKRYENEQSA
jgi:hypothetical protein